MPCALMPKPVSYTHLDVYKRQPQFPASSGSPRRQAADAGGGFALPDRKRAARYDRFTAQGRKNNSVEAGGKGDYDESPGDAPDHFAD